MRGIKRQEHQCQIKIFGLIKPSSSKNGRLTRNYKDKTRCIKSKVNTFINLCIIIIIKFNVKI